MVRLQQVKNQIPVAIANAFQFHIGPITTYLIAESDALSFMFQFHIGPITTLLEDIEKFDKDKFQFHIGPITTPKPNSVISLK